MNFYHQLEKSVVFHSCKYLEKKADKFLKKGNTTKAEKNLAKAEKTYKKAFNLFLESDKEKPNNADTLNYLGFTSRKLGNYTEAERYYLSGLKIKPNHKRINQYLGELYLNTNRKGKAKQMTVKSNGRTIRTDGFAKSKKRAIVTLFDGYNIDLFGV